MARHLYRRQKAACDCCLLPSAFWSPATAYGVTVDVAVGVLVVAVPVGMVGAVVGSWVGALVAVALGVPGTTVPFTPVAVAIGVPTGGGVGVAPTSPAGKNIDTWRP
jgi:hypothetical protein